MSTPAFQPDPCTDCGGGGSEVECAPFTTVGLCLSDGTPIGVVTSWDCENDVGINDGWINLRTGAYTPGNPPPGTVSCGTSQSIQVSGVFCDVLPDGTVAGLALVEYHYAADGSIESVRLVDATTGTTYAPQGDVTVCPAADSVMDFEPVVLCVVSPDGQTQTPFLRTFVRDPSTTTLSVSDTTLAGGPFAPPAGQVGRCFDVDTELYPLCVVNATGRVVRRVIAKLNTRADSGANLILTYHDPVTMAVAPALAAGESYAACPDCLTCEQQILCDDGADDPATITGTASGTGTLSNGVTYAGRGTGGVQSTQLYDGGNGEGTWWPAVYTFPNATIGNATWTFDKPSYVEFSVYMRWVDYVPNPSDPNNPNPRNETLLPANVEPVYLPDGYHWDPVTHVLSIDNSRGAAGNEPCTNLSAPTIKASARFRTTEPVSQVRTRYQGARVANCGVFGSQRVGAFVVDPTGQFLRTICRNCAGAVVSVTDTTLDGQTLYAVTGTPKTCPVSGSVSVEGPVDVNIVGGCCQPVQVCVQLVGTEEFISNEPRLTDGSVDTVWKWTPQTNGLPLDDPNFGPSPTATWYDMYRPTAAPLTRWVITDTDTDRPAFWITPHPSSSSAVVPPARAGEGPDLVGNADWIARSSFTLPADADPDSIRVQVTVLNADQYTTGFRLNDGPWQPIPQGGFNPTDPPNGGQGVAFTFGPAVIPGAQAGENTLYLRVRETVGGAAGVIAHLIVQYDYATLRSWTRMVCCDDSVYYIDDAGQRLAELPEGSTLVPCATAANSGVLYDIERDLWCELDATGIPTGGSRYSVVGYDQRTGDVAFFRWEYRDGTEIPAGPVPPLTQCSQIDLAGFTVLTGIERVQDEVTRDLGAAYPGLQSVTITVIAGSATVTANAGFPAAIPAGTSLTWSVSDTDDSSLWGCVVTGDADSDYLVNWTYKTTDQGVG